MVLVSADTLPLQSDEQIVLVRQTVRQLAIGLGFSLVDQTKIVTAASELARNTIQHGGGGAVLLETLNDGPRCGVRLTFDDQGPGIPDLALAMKDGYTTAGGLGLGLSGAKRLTNEFEIASTPGVGTRVVITKWK
jgi:serine/threonine-protein kinase RsbT